MKKMVSKWMLPIVFISALFVGIIGCEDEPNTSTGDYFASNGLNSDTRVDGVPDVLSISPSSVSITEIGQQQVLSIKGGEKPYTWSVADSDIGTVSPTVTQQDEADVVYTAKAVAANTITVVDKAGRRASISVSASGSGASPSIVPASVSFNHNINTNVTVSFSASGGLSPYSWSSSHPSVGQMSGSVWSSSQTPNAAWVANSSNTVTITVYVKDSNGETDTATIKIE